AHRHFERDRKDVEAGEDILGWPTARARNATEITRRQVHQIEDALFIELIRIVELASDDPSAVGERLDERVDERLIVESLFTAGRIAAVIALEWTQAVDEAIGLRPMVVRQYLQIPAENQGVIIVVPPAFVPVLIVVVRGEPRDLHGLGAAGQ